MNERLSLAVGFVLGLGLVISACGASPGRPADTEASIDAYRRAAAEDPTQPTLALALAEAELFVSGGDSAHAAAAIQRARALGASPLRVRFLEALDHDTHGRHSEALDAYLDALDAVVARPREPGAQALGEVALASIVELDDGVARFAERVEARLASHVEAELSPSLRHALGTLLIDLAYRRADRPRVRAVADSLGCIPSVEVLGPFGPNELLDFDRALSVEAGAVLPAQADLGFGRGVRARRAAEARGCAIHLGHGPVGGGGTTYAEATVTLPESGRGVLRVESPNALEVFVDGVSVGRVDRRREALGRVSYHPIASSPGPHRVRVKVSTRHPNPVLIVSLTDGEPAGLEGLDSRRDPILHYLSVTLPLARSEWVAAREALPAPSPELPAPMQVLSAAVALSDPLTPRSNALDLARRAMRAARNGDPGAWYPALQEARFEVDAGRVREALALLDRGAESFPEVVAFSLTRLELLEARGWHDRLGPALAEVRARTPGACRPLRAALRHAERRAHADEANELAEALVACDARSDARLQRLLRRREIDQAAIELRRLAGLEPASARFAILDSELTLARASGDEPRIDAILAELRGLMPQSANAIVAELDRRLGRGEQALAREGLLRAMREEPVVASDLARVARAILGESPLEAHRRDGREIVRAFEASGRTYENAPSVLVWDSTVTQVERDGSVTELVHQITRIQSEEALDEAGQVQPPEGALLLTVRTLKADGTRLEPDRIEGLEHIELPNLEVNDYVEVEYLRTLPPVRTYAGGAVGDRFYFQSFEVPFDTSRLVLVAPQDLELIFDPRGPAPTPSERREGDRRVVTWEVHESRPLVPEPGAVHVRELLASVAWGTHASWEAILTNLRDALADRDLVDPRATRLAREIVGSEPSTVEQQVARLSAWLRTHVEETGDVFGLAPLMLESRTGSRARLLIYLLARLGIPADLALVRSFGFDATPPLVPDEDTYGHVVVRVQGSQGPVWVALERYAAFEVLPAFLRGQEALLVREPLERVTLPDAPLETDLRSVAIDVEVRANGSATLHVTETFRGMGAASWRSELDRVPDAQLERVFDEQYVTRLFASGHLTRLRVLGREDAELPLVFEYDVAVDELGVDEDAGRRLPMPIPSLLEANYAPMAARHFTALVAPVALDLEVHLRSEGGTFEAPPPARIQGPAGLVVEYASSLDEAGLHLRRSVRIPRMRVSIADYPELARACRAADAIEQRGVLLTHP